jgi:hypothetical protein
MGVVDVGRCRYRVGLRVLRPHGFRLCRLKLFNFVVISLVGIAMAPPQRLISLGDQRMVEGGYVEMNGR